MADERRTDVRRKYASLGIGELTAAVVFGFIGVNLATRAPGDALSLWSGLLPLLVILVQVGVYWLLARGWAGRGSMSTGIAGVYRLFRILDPVLLAAGLAGIMMWSTGGFGLVLAVTAWLFGVVEYVNYFVVRLSYPILRWPTLIGRWSTPRLVRDLRTHAETSSRSS